MYDAEKSTKIVCSQCGKLLQERTMHEGQMVIDSHVVLWYTIDMLNYCIECKEKDETKKEST